MLEGGRLPLALRAGLEWSYLSMKRIWNGAICEKIMEWSFLCYEMKYEMELSIYKTYMERSSPQKLGQTKKIISPRGTPF